jgi:Cof subfamily protein (haloacid dehalogenase superfamily)
MNRSPDVKWIATDIDGTFVDPSKRITKVTRQVLSDLDRRGIPVTCISGRFPPGMKPLLLDAGFHDVEYGSLNGAVLLNADGTVADESRLGARLAQRALDAFESRGLDTYVFSSQVWYIVDPLPAHVAEEVRLLGFEPTLVPDFAPHLTEAVKVVGVSYDPELLQRAENELGLIFGRRATVARSSARFCDVTSPRGKKGRFIRFLRRLHGLDRHNLLSLGDMQSDVDMFRWSVGVAMGNAPDSVKEKAYYVTASNAEDGWAQAVEELVLRRR